MTNLARLIVLCVSCVAGSANALLITQTQNFALNNYLNHANGTGSSIADSKSLSTELTFNRFDASLGTLNGVSITFESDYRHYLYASARDSQYESRSSSWRCYWRWGCYSYSTYYYGDTVSVAATSEANVSIELTDPSSTLTASADTNSASCTRSGYNSTSSCYEQDYDTSTVFNGAMDLSTFELSEFVGADPINLLLTSIAGVSADCSGAERYCTASSDVNWHGAISVVYDYSVRATSSVSEPSGLVLLAFGALALYGRRRRGV